MNKPRTWALTLLLVGWIAALPAAAANDCKGLSKQACDGTQACSWVKGYTRKDGREVAPYCRAKAPPKSSAVSPPAGPQPPAG